MDSGGYTSSTLSSDAVSRNALETSRTKALPSEVGTACGTGVHFVRDDLRPAKSGAGSRLAERVLPVTVTLVRDPPPGGREEPATDAVGELVIVRLLILHGGLTVTPADRILIHQPDLLLQAGLQLRDRSQVEVLVVGAVRKPTAQGLDPGPVLLAHPNGGTEAEYCSPMPLKLRGGVSDR
jgi:hypothetical protein